MQNLLIQPCAGTEAQKHYQDTIVKGRPVNQIERFFNEKQIRLLKKIYADEPAQIWGFVPGERNINLQKWVKLEPGDLALFYKSKQIIYVSRVAFTTHSSELADYLWGRDSKGQRWEYIYFVNQGRPSALEIEKLNQILGYASNFIPQGAIITNSENTSEALSYFGDSDKLFGAIGLEAQDDKAKDIIKRSIPNVSKINNIDDLIKPLDNKLRDRSATIKQVIAKYIERNPRLSRLLKQKFNYRCQLCDQEGFIKKNGEPYAEAHHLENLASGGPDLSDNILVLCPNCHRKLHFADVKILFNEQKKLSGFEINGNRQYLKAHG